MADALKALGLTGKVLNVGFDASPAEVVLLKSGGVNATIAQPTAEEGAAAARFAYDKLTGDTSGIMASVQLPDVLLTSADASQAAYEKYSYIPKDGIHLRAAVLGNAPWSPHTADDWPEPRAGPGQVVVQAPGDRAWRDPRRI